MPAFSFLTEAGLGALITAFVVVAFLVVVTFFVVATLLVVAVVLGAVVAVGFVVVVDFVVVVVVVGLVVVVVVVRTASSVHKVPIITQVLKDTNSLNLKKLLRIVNITTTKVYIDILSLQQVEP